MQHSKFNVAKYPVGALFVAVAVTIAIPAPAGITVAPGQGDSLLQGSRNTPCTASPDYAAGVDAYGRAVVPADAAAPPVPVPDQIAVPLKTGGHGKDSAYVTIDGQKLKPLLNQPACH